MEMYIISAKLSVATPLNLNPYANLVHILSFFLNSYHFLCVSSSLSLSFFLSHKHRYVSTVEKDVDETGRKTGFRWKLKWLPQQMTMNLYQEKRVNEWQEWMNETESESIERMRMSLLAYKCVWQMQKLRMTSKIIAKFCLPISLRMSTHTHKHHVSQFSGDERVSN